jgi:lysophospholipase L1-like esterase
MNLILDSRCAIALLLLLSSTLSQAGSLLPRMPECRPFALREQATLDLDGARAISWYGDSRTVSSCVDQVTAGGDTVWSTLGQTIPMLSSGGRSYRQRAVGGTSLRELFEKRDGLNTLDWPAQMDADKSTNVVISHGTNDAWKDAKESRANGVAEFHSTLSQMVQVAKSKQKKVLLVQPFRVCDYDIPDPARDLKNADELLAPYADAVVKVGIAQGVVVAHLFAMPLKCHGTDPTNDLPDGLHSTQAHTNAVAAVVAEALNRVIDGGQTPAPTFTIARAPVDPGNKRQPIPGKDYQGLTIGGQHKNYWATTNATSLTYNCTSLEMFGYQYGYVGAGSVSALVAAGHTGSVGNWTEPSTCTWTVTGPGGTVAYKETFHSHSVPAAGKPTIVVTRSPMPLVAGQKHHNTWKTTNATSLTLNCYSSGTGFQGFISSLPLNSETHSGIADPAWVGFPTGCIWTAYGPGGATTYSETFHTVTR